MIPRVTANLEALGYLSPTGHTKPFHLDFLVLFSFPGPI